MTLRVFLVEDSQNARSLIQEALQAIGNVRVLGSAATEAEAIDWLQEHLGEWDLAILDLVLEQGSGLGVLGRTGKLAARGRLVVFSGFVTRGLREHCSALGADLVFDKADAAPFLRWLNEAATGPTGP